MQTEEKRENIEEKKEERMEMPVSGALEREPGKAPVSGAEISVHDTENGHPSEDVYILAIESSCDETAASVVKNGRTVLSNIISSQIRSSHAVWRRCAGDCVEKAYREDQPGY